LRLAEILQNSVTYLFSAGSNIITCEELILQPHDIENINSWKDVDVLNFGLLGTGISLVDL